MKSKINPSRRNFLKVSAVVGGGLAVGLSLPCFSGAATDLRAARAEINIWVVVNADDSIVIRVARSEMGQGSLTGLPMLVAEELECDWTKVRTEYVSATDNVLRKRVWGRMNSTGSNAIRGSHLYLRKAGAIAREMLIAAAAQKWNVPVRQCTAANSVISHAGTGRTVTFGQIAAAATKIAPPVEVRLKDPQAWKLLGKPVKRFDIPDTAIGKQIFGIDVRLPGMVYAAIAQCPVFGGKPAKVDSGAVAKMRGVLKIITLDDAIAVVADNWWRAEQALNKLQIVWDEVGHGGASTESIAQFVRSGLDDPSAAVARHEGDVHAAFTQAAKVIEAEYSVPFLAHATMEPMNCTAWIHDGRVDVWAPTQNAEASLAAAAAASGEPVEKIEIHKMQVGGGFGRRGFQDYVHQAIAVAKELDGRPVKLLWSRTEDMQHDFYRPMTMVRFKAGLDGAGTLPHGMSEIPPTRSWPRCARGE